LIAIIDSDIVAERRDVAVTPESLAADERTFAEVTARHGGSYDGWDATV
jgi:hypothetical protein